jgi:hypothetical protein
LHEESEAFPISSFPTTEELWLLCEEAFLYYPYPRPPLTPNEVFHGFPDVGIKFIVDILKIYRMDLIDEVHSDIAIIVPLSEPDSNMCSCVMLSYICLNC